LLRNRLLGIWRRPIYNRLGHWFLKGIVKVAEIVLFSFSGADLESVKIIIELVVVLIQMRTVVKFIICLLILILGHALVIGSGRRWRHGRRRRLYFMELFRLWVAF
jgi:hypothetical protein